MLSVDFTTEQDTLRFVFSVQKRSGSTYRRPKHTPASAFLYLTFPYPGAILTSEFCRKVNLLTEILFLPRPIRKTVMKKNSTCKENSDVNVGCEKINLPLGYETVISRKLDTKVQLFYCEVLLLASEPRDSSMSKCNRGTRSVQETRKGRMSPSKLCH